jgi:hypothetical protein
MRESFGCLHVVVAEDVYHVLFAATRNLRQQTLWRKQLRL